MADDDRADELAARLGPGGISALDVVSDVTRMWGLISHELRRVQTEEAPTLHPAVTDADQRHWDTPAPDTIEESLMLLGHESDQLAEAIRTYPTAQDWARPATVAGGSPITALDLVREAIKVGADGLTTVAETLASIRD